MKNIIIYIHGKGGNAGAGEHYKKFFPDADFGDDLSWEYLQYFRNNKISWTVPTEILYARAKNEVSLD